MKRPEQQSSVKKKKKFKKDRGTIYKYDNLLDMDFNSSRTNDKMVTYITIYEHR